MGILLGGFITLISLAITKPLFITRIVYDRAEECIRQDGEYMFFQDDEETLEKCEVNKELFKTYKQN